MAKSEGGEGRGGVTQQNIILKNTPEVPEATECNKKPLLPGLWWRLRMRWFFEKHGSRLSSITVHFGAMNVHLRTKG